MSGPNITRRGLLGLAGTVGVGGIAGCQSREANTTTTESPVSTGPQTTSTPTPAPEPAFDHFVERSGRHFTVDGEPFYTNGANNQYPYNRPRTWTRELFADAESMGLTSFRIECAIGHKWVNPSLQTGPYEYSEAAFRELDYVVEQAGKRGVRLIIALNDYWSPGGIQSYVDWAESATDRYEFYTNEECQEMFRSFVEHLLERTNPRTGVKYKRDPTIMMLELINEPQLRSNGSRDPLESDLAERERKLQTWIEDTADFVKSIDSNHLVSTGAEGYYNEMKDWMGGTDWYRKLAQDYIENHQPEVIDACSVHLYPKSFVHENRCVPDENCLDTLEYHVTDGHQKLEKPVYVGEFGFPVDRLADDVDHQLRERNRVLGRWYDKMAALEADGALLWTLYPHQMEIGDGGHGTYFLVFEEDQGTREIITEYSNTVNERSGAAR